jgi:hypothetical protein
MRTAEHIDPRPLILIGSRKPVIAAPWAQALEHRIGHLDVIGLPWKQDQSEWHRDHAAGPSAVAGAEHFADAMTSMECAATPVTDGAGQMTGVIDLTCAAGNFHPILLAGVSAAAAGWWRDGVQRGCLVAMTGAR